MDVFDYLTLENIFAPFLKENPLFSLSYLLIKSDNNNWLKDLENNIKPQHEEQLLAICLLIQDTSDKARIDSIFILCKAYELTSEFIDEIDKYITPRKNGDEKTNILGFLDKQWKTNIESYPLNFWWTTRTDENYTVMADWAIAPKYRGKNLMKYISLELISLLEKNYGSQHTLIASPIHHAVYLFFNPNAKSCKDFHLNEIEEKRCSSLLKMHEFNKQNKMPLPCPENKTSVNSISFSLFKPQNNINSISSLLDKKSCRFKCQKIF